MNLHDQYIPGRGPQEATIVVLGESGGREEAYKGMPFVGPSGQLLMRWMREAGIDPEGVRYENVYPFYPPEGNVKCVPLEEIGKWQQDCLARMDACQGARIYVPVGNLALATLVSKPGIGVEYLAKSDGPTAQWGFAKPGITAWRGSILGFARQTPGGLRCETVKVIPTIHPAAILYQRKRVASERAGAAIGGSPLWEKRCRADWRRIAAEREYQAMALPLRNLKGHPSPEDIEALLRACYDNSERPLCIDIETYPPQRRITCVSFALEKGYAISIPWSRENKYLIEEFCQAPNPKGGQNFFYDYLYLARHGVEVKNYRYDTRHMQHLRDPLESGSLAFQASIYTREPYYKPDSEESEKFWSGQKFEDLLLYNARDSAVTSEILSTHINWLYNNGKFDDYHRFYSDLYEPLLDMMQRGIRVEREQCGRAYQEARWKSLSMRNRACEIAERPLFKFKTQVERHVYAASQHRAKPDAGGMAEGHEQALEKALKRAKRTEEQIEQDLDDLMVSGQELGRVLREWGVALPKSHKNVSGETLDDTALMGLMLRYRSKGTVVSLLEAVLEHRHQRKLSEFFLCDKIDPDGYMRCEYGMTTKTNRLFSKENPFGTGRNLQNIPQAARWVFVPDPGQVFLTVDMSQAEARDVYCRTGDPGLIELAQSKPWEVDIHRANAAMLFGVSEADVTREQRQYGKIVEHASNYGMGPKKLQEQFLEAGIVKSVQECQGLIEKKFQAKPAIQEWQRRVRIQILQQRRLVNAWGREMSFEAMPLDDTTYRLGYAWGPQSDIGMLMNMRGVRPFWEWYRALPSTPGGKRARTVTQEHDGLTVSIEPDPELILGAIRYLRSYLELSFMVGPVALSIPMEVKLATSWCTDQAIAQEHGHRVVEFKRPPGLDEVVGALEEMCNVTV